jgi:uncharacterized membrane protein SpoIIM required for sporulation
MKSKVKQKMKFTEKFFDKEIMKIEKKPYEIFIIATVISILCFSLAYIFFPMQASMTSIFIITIILLPILYRILKIEEENDFRTQQGGISHHAFAIMTFLTMFLAITLTTSFLCLFMPQNLTNSLFNEQILVIEKINGPVGGFILDSTFIQIILNNLRVFIISFLFAFLFGAGAIYVLVWNATVLGVALGNLWRVITSQVLSEIGYINLSAYFKAFSIGFLRYFIHGIPEILAYLFSAFAGGIIATSIINHHISSKKAKIIIEDSFSFIILGTMLLLFGALIEVYLTPIFYM